MYAACPETELYDVIVLPNLYGDILGDLLPGWSAGWGWRHVGEKGAF